MFVVTDCTRPSPCKMNSIDVKGVRDIVLGITGYEEIADMAFRHAGNMQFGDSLVVNPYFILDCIEESEV